jgi:hypothetical protein
MFPVIEVELLIDVFSSWTMPSSIDFLLLHFEIGNHDRIPGLIRKIDAGVKRIVNMGPRLVEEVFGFCAAMDIFLQAGAKKEATAPP